MVVDSNDGIYICVARESTDISGSTFTERHLLKYNQDCDLIWSRQLGANGSQIPSHMVADGLAAVTRADNFAVNNGTGNVFIVGLDGMPDK